MKFLELVKRRRSIRRFKKKEISAEHEAYILECARFAPSGNNTQPWRFVVVRDEAVRKRLFEASGRQKFMLEAPLVIALLADITCRVTSPASVEDKENADNLRKIIRDAAIAGEHMVLAATDLSLGCCWNALFVQAEIKPVLNVPDDHYVVALLAIGHPDENPSPRERHPMEKLAYKERFGEKR